MSQIEISFDKYPRSPGWKKDGTSKDAARRMKRTANTLRDQVLSALRYEPMTSDECAAAIGKSVLSVRPRITELFKLGLIEESGVRRLNESGAFAAVWRVKK